MNKLLFSLSFLFLLNGSLFAQSNKTLPELLSSHSFTSADGQSEKSLADILAQHKGKVIYIDFWASWCGPCKKEMPSSKKLHEELGDEVVFLYLSVDDKADAWQKALDKLEIRQTGEHWRRGGKDSKELLRFFYIYSIPHYLIVDTEGQFVDRDALRPSDPKAAKKLQKWVKKAK
ncbi:TlpA disulfide reductase family protein [Saprospira sp. CCB-QB6]|uniref:TlpA family protein disulfide reductase n=1 Tax=Saprospira sp. CCB-QB6 TaxID=3023936 RepID=UPI0023493865|nr:TlpA disulfide reductase family protein [Saprospira sp. CCB-QB6]WCL80308.1 TlpA disulfide reductase family protein [Saprospira sp. CCB-QB6]